MILIDANLLIYAAFRDMPQHEAAREWLEQTLAAEEAIALPWAVLAAFVRIATNPRLMSAPLPIEEAISHIEEWLDLPNVHIIAPTDRHRITFAAMLRGANAGGNLVTDAHLAALSLEHQCRIATTDGDFARFPGITWFNPIAG